MNYLRYTPYIIIIFFICYITYKEYDSNKTSSELKSEIIRLQNIIRDSESRQHEFTIKIMREFNDSQDVRMREMRNDIDKINTTVDINNNIIAKLHTTTKNIDNSISNYSEPEKDAYIREINNQFRESTELLVEIGKESDENHSAAVMYYNMLVDAHKISLGQTHVDFLKESDTTANK